MYRGFLAPASVLFMCWVPLAAQQPASAGVQKIVALQGEGATNNIQTATAVEPVVEVRDERDLPVAGAEVTFQLPDLQSGRLLPGTSLVLKTRSNDQGQAAGTGFTLNDVPGPFSIRVTAGSGGKTASLVIHQRNVANAEAARHGFAKSRSKKWTIIAIVAGAAVTAGIIIALRSGGSSSSNTVTVSTGPVTVGGPQ